MGNLLFASSAPKEKDDTADTIINLSESCIERLSKEEKESPKKTVGEELLNVKQDVSEKEWMMKLKCIDDAHSNYYDLTMQGFQKLVEQVESQLEPIRENPCDGTDVINCINKNRCCAIRCQIVMDKYIDCIDTLRINIIKEKVESDLKEKRKEDQVIVEEFLKNENG